MHESSLYFLIFPFFETIREGSSAPPAPMVSPLIFGIILNFRNEFGFWVFQRVYCVELYICIYRLAYKTMNTIENSLGPISVIIVIILQL